MTGVSDLSEEFSSDELRGLDSEGRCVITRHSVLTSSGDTRHLVIINVYCPRADPERAERGKYQQQFYKALDIRANRLREAGDCVIICGDINTSHKEVDHCDPYEEFSDKPGRRFLTHFLRDLASEATLAEAADDDNQDDWVSTSVRLEERQFVDTFRIFHPDRKHAFTCWSTKGNCRSTNYGTRIDYVFASVNMTDFLADCDIQPDVLGSDHCPVLATFKLRSQPAARPPDNCTKYFKEFSGKQVKLSNFFIKTDKTSQDKLDQAVTAAKKPKTETKSKITSFFVAKDPKPKIEKSVEYKASVTEVQPKKSSQEFGNNNAKAAWGSIFKPLPPAPHCTKHKEQAVKRKVTKKGPNTGREFWGCSRGEGRADDPEARCDFFKWVK